MKRCRVVHVLLFGCLLLTIPAVFSSTSAAQIGIFVRIGPPPLPVYEQPICPGPGYLWAPGYWAWSDDDGYYWVPGTWVEAPEPGLLWTPGYWGWNNGVYAWNAGYWGPQVGFYGGINYGYGYGGNGFYGGEWRGGHFFYNTAVMRVNTTVIKNVYVNKTVIVNNNTHVAFNGGQGGVQARPTAQQETYMHQQHTAPVAAQLQQRDAASKNRALFASTNHGRPAVAATARPGEFSGKGVVAAKAAGGTYHAPKMSPKEARASAPPAKGGAPANHAENRPAANHSASHAAASRPAENRAANHPANHPGEEKAANHPAKPAPAPRHEAAPKPAAHPAPAPRHEAAPKPAAHPAPAPRHEAPPKPAAHPAPKPERQAAPPKRENPPPKREAPPKEEHKGPQAR
ncbi:MAG: YXWGXW repeat-containing protein [Candidatus Sulfotelmatobacter sp.]